MTMPPIGSASLVLVVACSAPSAAPQATPAPVTPQTYDIAVDPASPALNISTFRYSPNAIQVHPGDTLRFTFVERPAPPTAHTVTFGTVATAAVTALGRRDPATPWLLPPEFRKLPELIVGVPPNRRLNVAAALPCFLDAELPPDDGCPPARRTQAAFTGTQSFYSSGAVLSGGDAFVMTLTPAIAPGTYGFLCLQHGQFGMFGHVTVVEPTRAVPSPAEVRQAAATEIDEVVRALQAEIDRPTGGQPGAIRAGIFAPRFGTQFTAAIFSPKQATVPLGGSLTWEVFGPHSIAFNAPDDAVGFITKSGDGLKLNLKALLPANTAAAPPPNLAAPAVVTIAVDSGPYDGVPYRSSGFLRSLPPAHYLYTITFTRPGKFAYRCLIHQEMEGSVAVGP